MEDRGTSRRYCEDAKIGCEIERPPEELFDAYELAGRLERLLGQEAESLRGLENRQLLKILHRKESLIRELAAKLDDLEKAKDGRRDISRVGQYISLKTCLRQIDKLNRSNEAFIEGALSHYRDFMNCVCPSGYSSRYPGESGLEIAGLKGRTLRREI